MHEKKLRDVSESVSRAIDSFDILFLQKSVNRLIGAEAWAKGVINEV